MFLHKFQLSLLTLFVSLIAGMLIASPSAVAQDSGDAIVYVWNDELVAQGIGANEMVTAERFTGRETLPAGLYGNAFEFEDSPLSESPVDGYGFYQGVWSADQTAFAYLAIQPNNAGYHVVVVEDGQQRILFSGEVSIERGYLVPVGWASDGALILLERHMLHNLSELKLWRFAEGDATPSLDTALAVPLLKGNSASLGEGWVFVGFDTTNAIGYQVNVDTKQVITFPTSLTLDNPPASVFETYPVDVVGVVDLAEFSVWADQLPEVEIVPIDPSTLREPFLHWMLPDAARSITCYPDSEWTHSQFPAECVGLSSRPYPGHEGTDVGGMPNGLEIGTPVYATAPGLVVGRYTACESGELTCGDSYGNHVLMEHTLIVDHNVETWFSGYGHLQALLVGRLQYIDEIGVPIALSGDTGVGGAHLHFEVRYPRLAEATNWIDPWDIRQSVEGTGLWIGGNAHPTAAETS